MGSNQYNNINSVQCQNNAIFKNSILYLHELTNSAELNVPTLKSLYRTKCRLMELRTHAFMQNSNRLNRCERCFLKTIDYSQTEIQPIKIPHFAKKIFAKLDQNKPLTECQREYYKKISKKNLKQLKNKHKLVKSCGFCGKKSITFISKPESLISRENQLVSIKRKKKKFKNIWLDAFDKSSQINTKSIQQNTKNSNDGKNNLQQTIKIEYNKISSGNKTISSKETDLSKINSEKKKKKDIIDVAPTTSSLADRSFLNSDYKPLEKSSKKGKFQVSKPTNLVTEAPLTPTLIKAKEKQKKKHKKKMESLNKILKNAENKKTEPTKLQTFLSSL